MYLLVALSYKPERKIAAVSEAVKCDQGVRGEFGYCFIRDLLALEQGCGAVYSSSSRAQLDTCAAAKDR